MVFGLVGTYVAYLAAQPLGNLLRPYTLSFFNTPTTWTLVPPVACFMALVVFVYAVSQGVHMKVYLHFKYKTSDEQWSLWERMNTNVGLCLGVLNGVLVAGIVLAFVYSVGYPIMLTQPSDSAPAMYRYMGKARADLKSSGFEKLAAAMDRTPEKFYQGADVLGLLYQNPDLQGRLLHYPLFLSLSGTPEFVKLLAGPETRQILSSKTPFTRLFDTNSMGLLRNKFVFSQLAQVDPADLLEFSKTGKSPKYDADAVIGVWEINLLPTVNQIKQNHPDVTPVDLVKVKRVLRQMALDIVLVSTPDGQLFLRGNKLDFGQVKALVQARWVARSSPAPEGEQQNPGGQQPPPPQDGPQGAPSLTDVTQGPLMVSGHWSKEGEMIKVEFREGDNQTQGELTVLNEDNIVIKLKEGSLVFSRYR